MNNQAQIERISTENYNGYEIRINKYNKSYSAYAISHRNAALQQKDSSNFNYLKGEYFSAHNLEQAEAYVVRIKAKIDEKVKAKEARLAEKAKAREEFVNPYKVGDILHSSWGYEQTNVEFYQIVAVGNRSLKLRQIGSESVRSTSWCSEEVAPKKGKFVSDEVHRVNIVIRSYNGNASHSIKSPIHGYLYQHTGGTHHSSWGH